MKWTTLFQVELTKIRRSKILLLLILPAVILWVPNVMNASLNFQMDDIGISPENSFMIQGSWDWPGFCIRPSWWC